MIDSGDFVEGVANSGATPPDTAGSGDFQQTVCGDRNPTADRIAGLATLIASPVFVGSNQSDGSGVTPFQDPNLVWTILLSNFTISNGAGLTFDAPTLPIYGGLFISGYSFDSGCSLDMFSTKLLLPGKYKINVGLGVTNASGQLAAFADGGGVKVPLGVPLMFSSPSVDVSAGAPDTIVTFDSVSVFGGALWRLALTASFNMDIFGVLVLQRGDFGTVVTAPGHRFPQLIATVGATPA